MPRHTDFGANALARTFIAVYVFPMNGIVPAFPKEKDKMIALMDIRIVKNM